MELTSKEKKAISPPKAEKRDHKIELFGKSWNDPYFWLRNKEEDDVTSYLKAENEYTKHIMKPTDELQEKIFQEIKGRINETDQSVPTKEGEYYYYSRTEEGKSYNIYCRKFQSMSAEEEILLDVNKLAEGKEFCQVGSVRVSPDHKFIAYSVDFEGYYNYTIYFEDLISKNKLGYSISDSAGSIEWASNDKIYYNTRDDINRSNKILLHQLYEEKSNQLIYEEKNKEFLIYFYKSTDKKILFIISYGRESQVVRYIQIKENLVEFSTFNTQIDQVEYNFDHHDGYLYFVTSKDALNSKLCRTKIGHHSEDNWFELVTHDENRKLSTVNMFKSFGVLSYRENGMKGYRIFSLPDFIDHTIELPEQVYAIYGEENPNYDTEYFRFQYSSLVTPKTIYDYHVPTKKLVKKKQDFVKDYEPNRYVTRRDFVVSRDGTRVPISISYKKGIDKPAPLLLYGYGSYGYPLDTTFSSSRVSLLERGIIYVMAHVRGGGEMGKKWYHDGKLLKKKNTFTDFIDVAKYLISTGYTTKDKLAIEGRSAGGLLVGAVVNMEPSLFKSVVAGVPFVDVISTMLDDTIPLTTFEYLEWGNPAESEKIFNYMYEYSPYDQIGNISTDYPNMLVLAGLNDAAVHYWEPAKFTAKLRDIKTDDNLLILKTNMGAGHGGASDRYDYMKEIAFSYSFLILTLELALE